MPLFQRSSQSKGGGGPEQISSALPERVRTEAIPVNADWISVPAALRQTVGTIIHNADHNDKEILPDRPLWKISNWGPKYLGNDYYDFDDPAPQNAILESNDIDIELKVKDYAKNYGSVGVRIEKGKAVITAKNPPGIQQGETRQVLKALPEMRQKTFAAVQGAIPVVSSWLEGAKGEYLSSIQIANTVNLSGEGFVEFLRKHAVPQERIIGITKWFESAGEDQAKAAKALAVYGLSGSSGYDPKEHLVQLGNERTLTREFLACDLPKSVGSLLVLNPETLKMRAEVEEGKFAEKFLGWFDSGTKIETEKVVTNGEDGRSKVIEKDFQLSTQLRDLVEVKRDADGAITSVELDLWSVGLGKIGLTMGVVEDVLKLMTATTGVDMTISREPSYAREKASVRITPHKNELFRSPIRETTKLTSARDLLVPASSFIAAEKGRREVDWDGIMKTVRSDFDEMKDDGYASAFLVGETGQGKTTAVQLLLRDWASSSRTGPDWNHDDHTTADCLIFQYPAGIISSETLVVALEEYVQFLQGRLQGHQKDRTVTAFVVENAQNINWLAFREDESLTNRLLAVGDAMDKVIGPMRGENKVGLFFLSEELSDGIPGSFIMKHRARGIFFQSGAKEKQDSFKGHVGKHLEGLVDEAESTAIGQLIHRDTSREEAERIRQEVGERGEGVSPVIREAVDGIVFTNKRLADLFKDKAASKFFTTSAITGLAKGLRGLMEEEIETFVKTGESAWFTEKGGAIVARPALEKALRSGFDELVQTNILRVKSVTQLKTGAAPVKEQEVRPIKELPTTPIQTPVQTPAPTAPRENLIEQTESESETGTRIQFGNLENAASIIERQRVELQRATVAIEALKSDVTSYGGDQVVNFLAKGRSMGSFLDPEVAVRIEGSDMGVITEEFRNGIVNNLPLLSAVLARNLREGVPLDTVRGELANLGKLLSATGWTEEGIVRDTLAEKATAILKQVFSEVNVEILRGERQRISSTLQLLDQIK